LIPLKQLNAPTLLDTPTVRAESTVIDTRPTTAPWGFGFTRTGQDVNLTFVIAFADLLPIFYPSTAHQSVKIVWNWAGVSRVFKTFLTWKPHLDCFSVSL
jgi:hypothetical protein